MLHETHPRESTRHPHVVRCAFENDNAARCHAFVTYPGYALARRWLDAWLERKGWETVGETPKFWKHYCEVHANDPRRS